MYKVIVAYSSGELQKKLNHAAETGFYLSGQHQATTFKEAGFKGERIMYSAIAISQEKSLGIVQGYVGAIEEAVDAN